MFRPPTITLGHSLSWNLHSPFLAHLPSISHPEASSLLFSVGVSPTNARSFLIGILWLALKGTIFSFFQARETYSLLDWQLLLLTRCFLISCNQFFNLIYLSLGEFYVCMYICIYCSSCHLFQCWFNMAYVTATEWIFICFNWGEMVFIFIPFGFYAVSLVIPCTSVFSEEVLSFLNFLLGKCSPRLTAVGVILGSRSPEFLSLLSSQGQVQSVPFPAFSEQLHPSSC